MNAVIWTIEERCKQCYTCIRECPAKAIKVEKGQAKVIESRCIGCGHCVRVCSQGAKAILDAVPTTLKYLAENDEPVIAMLAPSFPSAFSDLEPEKLVGALRECGFDKVVEVAFGADLVNQEYVKMSPQGEKHQWPETRRPVITTSCPAIYNYVEKYVPELIDHLAPIVSPMVAMGRAVHRIYGKDVKNIFIGPCTAKKFEAQDPKVTDSVDQVLTFRELEEMFQKLSVEPRDALASWFDPPHPFLGRVYPVCGGLVRSSGLPYDIMDNDIIMAEGKQQAMRLLECAKECSVKASLVDILFCEGCIAGPFINHTSNYFTRKQKIIEYAESRRERTNYAEWSQYLEKCKNILLHRDFTEKTVKLTEPSESEIQRILAGINKYTLSDELNCGACGYNSCQDYARAVHFGLAEREMCMPFLIENLRHTQGELQESLEELAETQDMLIQHEKLASIGQLAAGVAHEVNNPLGSIMLYAHLLLQKMQDEKSAKDLKFIVEEAKRCQKIVSGLLNFSRQGKLNLRKLDIADTIKKMVKLTEKHPLFKNVELRTEIEPDLPEVEIDPEQIYQVFLNLAVNAAEAMPKGGILTLCARSDEAKDRLILEFRDNGHGIAPENMKKLFTPFFTTKQIGKGTGLGLAIAYGIVKMHRGAISVKSEPEKGSTFTITLPVKSNLAPNSALLQ
jgi:signal transduction histidine kinase/iron only hydrogenase large subunit-like protein